MGGGEISGCGMSILRKANVGLLNLRKAHVAMSNLGNSYLQCHYLLETNVAYH